MINFRKQSLLFVCTLLISSLIKAQECGEVLKTDLFNLIKIDSKASYTDAIIDWIDRQHFTSKSKATQKATAGGLKIAIPDFGSAGATFKDGKVKTSENIEYSSVKEFMEKNQEFKKSYEQEIKNYNPNIEAWSKCVAEKRGMMVSYNEDSKNGNYKIEIWYRPLYTMSGPIAISTRLKIPDAENIKREDLKRMKGAILSVNPQYFILRKINKTQEAIVTFRTNDVNYSGKLTLPKPIIPNISGFWVTPTNTRFNITQDNDKIKWSASDPTYLYSAKGNWDFDQERYVVSVERKDKVSGCTTNLNVTMALEDDTSIIFNEKCNAGSCGLKEDYEATFIVRRN